MASLRRLGAFLSDFLVGDAPELFVGPLVALALVWSLLQAGLDPVVAGLVLAAAVVLTITIHLAIALRGAA